MPHSGSSHGSIDETARKAYGDEANDVATGDTLEDLQIKEQRWPEKALFLENWRDVEGQEAYLGQYSVPNRRHGWHRLGETFVQIVWQATQHVQQNWLAWLLGAMLLVSNGFLLLQYRHQRSSMEHLVISKYQLHRDTGWKSDVEPQTRRNYLPLPADESETAVRPKIFMYDLPSEWIVCAPHLDMEMWKTYIYGAEIMVNRLINSSIHRTWDPEEADFYYVPALFYCGVKVDGKGGLERYPQSVVDVIGQINSSHPYWARSGGRDHIVLLSQDHGFCGFATNEGTTDILKDAVILQHWGLKDFEIGCDWYDRLHHFGHCLERDLQEELLPPGSDLPCYNPSKDVLIPYPGLDDWEWTELANGSFAAREVYAQHSTGSAPVLQAKFAFPQLMLRPLLDLAKERSIEVDFFNASLAKTIRLYFIGGVRHDDPSYSHGIRQTLRDLFQNETGFHIINAGDPTEGGYVSLPEMMLNMAQSTFCLALTGAGWGVRLKQSLLAGCIPVVIADNVDMPSEEILPFQDFALRISPHAMYRLPYFLEEVVNEPGRVATMQQRLNCAWRYLSYHPDHGRAEEALVCSLRYRLFGPDAIWPAMDWETCTLMCTGRSELQEKNFYPPRLSMSSYGHKMHRFVHRAGQ